MFTSINAHAQIDLLVRDWPIRVLNFFNPGRGVTGLQTSDAIYNSESDFDLATFALGSTEMILHTTREIYDNYDLLGTWTVIDRFYIESDTPFLNWAANIPLGGMAGQIALDFYIGGTFGLHWVDVRQISPQLYHELPTINEEAKKIEASSWYQNSLHPQTPNSNPNVDPETVELPVASTHYQRDPSFRPRFVKLLNRVTFPFREPFTTEKFAKLEDGEILSYSGTGQLEVGGSVGWQLSQLPLVDQFNITADFKTYVEGDYTISVLKKSDRFALVKATRGIMPMGRTLTITQDDETKVVNRGFVVINTPKIAVGKVRAHLLPFEFYTDAHDYSAFDVGYQYDLQNADARAAYEKAVIGKFALSEQLAVRDATNDQPAVTRQFNTHSNSTNKFIHRALFLSIFFSDKKDHSIEDLSAKVSVAPLPVDPKTGEPIIERPEQEPTVPISLRRESDLNHRDVSRIFGDEHKVDRNFIVTLDTQKYAKNDPDALTFIAENAIEHTRTTPRRLKNAIQDATNFTGKTGLFPSIPANFANGDLVSNFGRAYFYYGFSLVKNEVDHFVSLTDAEKAKVMAQTFHVSNLNCGDAASASPTPTVAPTTQKVSALDSSASDIPTDDTDTTTDDDTPLANVNWSVCRFYQRWLAITPALPIQTQVQKLGELFSDRRHVEQWMDVVKNALATQPINYFVIADNAAFGRVQYHSQLVTPSDQVLNTAAEPTQFELQPAQLTIDQGAPVNNISSQLAELNGVKLHFETAAKPRWLFFRVTQVMGGNRASVVTELVRANADGKFVAGANDLLIGRLSPDAFGREIGTKIVPGFSYVIDVGYSRDASSWGPTQSTTFKIEASN